jgi:hypothetical protein
MHAPTRHHLTGVLVFINIRKVSSVGIKLRIEETVINELSIMKGTIMKRIILIFICFGFAVPAFADTGVVEIEDVCNTGYTVIKTTDGQYVVADYDSGAYLYEGNEVSGNLKISGIQNITRSDGESGQFYIDVYGSNIDDVLEDLCD